MAVYAPEKWDKLPTSTLKTLVGGASAAGLAVPTGDTLIAMRKVIGIREGEEAKLRAAWPTMVGSRPLSSRLYEIHNEVVAE